MTDPTVFYAETHATDEALLLFIRKVRQLHPDAYADVITKIPEPAQRALTDAESRVEILRAYDLRHGIARVYPDRFTGLEECAADLDKACADYNAARVALGTAVPYERISAALAAADANPAYRVGPLTAGSRNAQWYRAVAAELRRIAGGVE